MEVYISLTDRLRTQHQAIENIIATIDSRRIQTRPQPGKWNIHDNIAHLAKYQPVFLERIHQILLEDNPFFGRYKAEEDPEFEKWIGMDIDALIKQIDHDRKGIFDFISGLTEIEVNRTGVHKKFGPLNIIQWTEFFLLHEAHHIFTIFQLAHDSDL